MRKLNDDLIQDVVEILDRYRTRLVNHYCFDCEVFAADLRKCIGLCDRGIVLLLCNLARFGFYAPVAIYYMENSPRHRRTPEFHSLLSLIYGVQTERPGDYRRNRHRYWKAFFSAGGSSVVR